MSPAFWIWSHLTFALLIASILSLIVKCRSRLQSVLLCLSMPAVLGVLPIGQTDVSGFALAHMGTLSASMLVLLAFQLFANCGFVEAFSAPVWRNMNMFWLVTGAVLYPSALGLFDHDVYTFGFRSTMSWCVLGVSCAVALCNYRMLAFCLALSVLAHQLQFHESCNQWDYMIDPWLWIAAAVSLISGACRRLFASTPQNTGEGQGVSPPSVPQNLPTAT